MENYINKIYARTDNVGVVTKIFSEAFEQPLASDIVIDANNTDRHGAQRHSVKDDNGIYNYCIVNGVLVARDKTNDTKQLQLQQLRNRRQSECFVVINRGQLWYDTLTAEQKSELNSWYKAWLDVTATAVVPTRPSWIL